MIGLTTTDAPQPYRRCIPDQRKSARCRYIVRDWSAEKFDLPVYERRGKEKKIIAPEDCVVIINANGDCFYAARDGFASAPVDSDEWSAAAWKFLSKRAGGGRAR